MNGGNANLEHVLLWHDSNVPPIPRTVLLYFTLGRSEIYIVHHRTCSQYAKVSKLVKREWRQRARRSQLLACFAVETQRTIRSRKSNVSMVCWFLATTPTYSSLLQRRVVIKRASSWHFRLFIDGEDAISS